MAQAKDMVKTEDAGLSSDFGAVIQALAFTPSWNETNFQVREETPFRPLMLMLHKSPDVVDWV